MGDPRIGPESEEAIKFNLQQADKKFVESLRSATSEDQVRQAIEDLHSTYSDAITDSTVSIYIPKFINALQNLRKLPEKLKRTINMCDYDQVNTLLDGLSDDFIAEEDKLERDEDKPSFQWAKSIDQLFQELGVIED
jgi:hypothetical protein